MIKKNLFILRSPLQIINALEAIEYFKLKDCILVVVYNSVQSNTIQMKKLIERYSWLEIIEIDSSGKSKLFKYYKLIKYLKKNIYEYIFIGNFGTFQKIALPNLSKDEVYYLDDGTETIKVYNNYIKYNKYNKYNAREIRFLLLGLKIKIRDKINLFTFFDIEKNKDIKVIKNDLESFQKNYLKNSKEDNNIYFIGQPLDDVGVLDIKDYCKVLESLNKYYSKKIKYIPHRSESKDLENEILKLNEDIIEIIKPNIPIELYFMEKEIYPKHVVSFFSTALTTLGIIYKKAKIDVIKIPLEKIENKKYYDDFLEDYYKNIKKEKILEFRELGV